MQIDFSINILCADATTPMMPFQNTGACDPDCDAVSTFPVPPGGAVEGEAGYACTMGGDCHLLVVDKSTNKLWEMWQAFYPPDPSIFYDTSGAFIWDLTKAYPMNLRGDGCTSADAGGFPIAAMLFTADEIAAGHIDHAIRFILPNSRIQGGNVYVHPGTHTTSAASAPMSGPPYGVHMRLKSSFDLSKLNAGGQIVAKAMQKYGMFLADGGNIALTAANDQFTTAKWTDPNVNLSPQDLFAIQVSDFDVVDLGALVTTGDNCVRNP
jgi:serine/threonine-protein kinase